LGVIDEGLGVYLEIIKCWLKEHLMDFVYVILAVFWAFMSYHYFSVLMTYVKSGLWLPLWSIYKEGEWWLIVSLIMFTYVIIKWFEHIRDRR